jgi:hypothetical protein
MRYIEMIKPASVLDIGAGVGKWGFLCRDRFEFLEGRYERHSWCSKIYGIEIFEGYRNPIWEYYYDSFWVGNALEVLEDVPKVELVLLADVIEHLPKEEGRQLLAQVENKGRYLLISTPSRFFKGEHNDNPMSEHISFWGPADFSERWFITEEQGDTRLFFIDLRERKKRCISVEPAERNTFAALLRSIACKVFHRFGLPTGSFVSPHILRNVLLRGK